MASQRIENERPGRGEHGVYHSNGEQRADSAAFSTLPSDLECELQG
jgi:hypothetical protein